MKRIFTPERKKIVFLDMNRTLLDPDQSFDEAFVSVLREFTGRWEGGDGWTPEQSLRAYRKLLPPGAAKIGKTAEEKANLHALGSALQNSPIGFNPTLGRTFLRKVQERQEVTPKLFAGVRETLEALARGYALAIISNGSRQRQEKYMQRLGLSSLIPTERLFTFQKGAMRKPEPAIFHHALHAMNLTPGQGVMVGDSWRNDVMGAAGVGMDAVWLNPANTKKSSLRKVGSVKVIVVKRFEQLRDIF